ncbi:zinc finger protein CONSTANS-LIKE 2 isoform X2 [Amaranthus tricolor]|uniref:zinc finger protein CONSTANS-LIKE 2 isoform X2 n=1 Tax=Amaranthus tricolor TaxID=29722 RepID=UPI00258A8ADB|nr:zinc finger protein CONSTANS-LIKE 2 isoform X2 [Amaranthus tricolor]
MMMKEEIPGGDTNSWARVCDTCQSAPCTVYCKADSAYLCTSCDARIHAANQVASRHERVWVCEACERAPAAFLCKADAASLCATCDADIHSANPLARRHQRVPIMPVAGCVYGPPGGRMSADKFLGLTEGDEHTTDHEGDEDEAASWLLLNPGGDNQFCEQYNPKREFSVPEKNCVEDSVVPVQCGEGKDHHQIQYQNFLFGMECETKSGYNYNTSISHSVSVSSLDVGVVPESSMSDISVSHQRASKGTIELFSSPTMQVPTQLSPMDREARVMRYREKKKNRKFEKTIRYASRKAYAETRPRIKGRFAKRTDVEAEMDQMFTNSLMADNGYSIVPSF